MMSQRKQQGFTLVEMIMVIVITGIIGGMVAMFIGAPVRQYVDMARRADMTDIADTALRRVSRDLRLALPNSVRVTGACGGGDTCFIEFLPTSGGGRYRGDAAPAGAAAGCGSLAADVLDFDAADGCFEVLGPMPPAFVGGEAVVVYNLGFGGASAYAGNNLAAVGGAAAPVINIAPLLFPFDSPGRRFHVVTSPVTYVCSPAAGGGGTLRRYWGYAIQPDQPNGVGAGNALLGTTGAVLANQASALLATNVSSCRFSYAGFVTAERSGLVNMHLEITEQNPDGGNETVALYSSAHVSNQP